MRNPFYSLTLATLVALVACGTASTPTESEVPGSPLRPDSGAVPLDDLTAYDLYAPGNWWSRDVSEAPVDPASEEILRFIVADNGSDMFVTGTMDPRWNNDELNPAFRALTSDDFEVVELGWR